MNNKHHIFRRLNCFIALLCCLGTNANAQLKPAEQLLIYEDSAEHFYFVVHDSALLYLNKCLKLLENKELISEFGEKNIETKKAKFYQNIATCYNIMGKFDTAINYYNISLNKARELKDTNIILTNINNGAAAYMNLGIQDTALNLYLEGVALIEHRNEPKYKKYLSSLYSNIGNYYNEYSADVDLDKGIEYQRKAINAANAINTDEKYEYIATAYTYISSQYFRKKMMDSSLYYAKLALPIQEKIKDYTSLASTLSIIGNIYQNDSLFDQALQYKQKAKEISILSGSMHSLPEITIEMAYLYFNFAQKTKGNEQQENIKHALTNAMEAYNLTNKSSAIYTKSKAAKLISDIYSMQKMYKDANEYLNIHLQLSDSIHNAQITDNVLKIENKYMSERNDLLQKDIQTTAHLIKNRERMLIVVAISSVLILCMLILTYQRMRLVSKQRDVIGEQKQLIQEQKEEMEAQRDFANKQRDEIAEQKQLILQQKEEVETQRDFLNRQNKEIQSSIAYAKQIQNAVLPNISFALPMFVLYLPRDIVSGDFYWCSQHGDTMLLAVADCTGHGVPGACMSMLGLSYLHEISLLHLSDTPAQMLELLRHNIITALGQTGAVGETRDGMDITVCKYNIRTGELEFASAYNPLLVVPQNGEPYTIKGDRQPVAYIHNRKPFTNQTLQLQAGDTFYLMSDGLRDLFNPSNQKFSYKRIVGILDEMRSAPMPAQLERLLAEAESWASGTKQTDDMTLMGFRCPEKCTHNA